MAGKPKYTTDAERKAAQREREKRYVQSPKGRATQKRARETWRGKPGNKELHAAASRAWTLRLKQEVFAAYGGARCACCGEDTFAFLTLDHMNDDGADHRRTIVVRGEMFYSALRKAGFPQEPSLRVMCFNCNCGRRLNNGICPHQATSATGPSANG
jgi:hypothetical protein